MKNLTDKQTNDLFKILKSRFESNMNRHPNMDWDSVFKRLSSQSDKIWSLHEMERTGGEPDVVDYYQNTDEYVFYDCSKETPEERRNVCYDREALESRKKFKPSNDAVNMAYEMGIKILNEDEYRYLQTLGEFDLKTSSWLETPGEIRKLGGAIFGDRRYNSVFIYHNGADSYYSVRGFRGLIRV